MGIRFRLGAGLLLAVSLIAASVVASAQNDPPPYDIHGYDFHSPEFYNVWERTDRPVQEGATARSWLWGPAANTPLIEEPYFEADDGNRLVQYSDKSRMEMPVPGSTAAADSSDSPWFITQGLLARELMTGMLQVGDDLFEQHAPSTHPAAGDPDGVTAPSYATMGTLMNADARAEGQVITQFLHSSGQLENIQALEVYGVTDEYFTSETGYYIADVFWAFMISSGPVYEDGILQTGQVFESPFYAVGFPLGPAVWTWTKVDNVKQNVLIQCFERRCLTYTPDNEPDWQVESGNIGQHYFHWRYHEIDQPPVDDDDGVADDGVADDGVADDGVADDDPPVDEPVSFTVSPQTSTNLVGTSHEITVTVEGDDDEPFEGASVSASVTDGPHEDTNLSPPTATTGADGTATLSYTGTETGTDTITVTVAGIDDTQTVAKTWVEYIIELDPEDAENVVGTEYLLTATLTDSDGAVELDDNDDFSVSISREDDDGSSDLDDTDFDVEVNTDGEIEVSYTGPTAPAVDTITVSVTVDVGGVEEEITASTTKTWVADDPYEIFLAHIESELDDTDDFDPTVTETNTVGTDHTVYALALDQYGNPVQDGTEIDFIVTDSAGNSLIHVEETEETTDGIATFTYTGPTETREDGITASWGDDVPPDPSSNTLIKEWVAGDPFGLELTIGDQQEGNFGSTGQFPMSYRVLTVQLVDEFGNEVEDEVAVTFEATATHGQFFDFPATGHGATRTVNTDVNTGSASVQYGANPDNYPTVLNVDVDVSSTGFTTLEESFQLINPNP